MMSEYEEMLKRLGSFGPYQIRVFVLVSMFETPLAWAMLLPIFTGATPEWKCLVPQEWDFEKNLSSLHESQNMSYNNAENDSDKCQCAQLNFSKEFTSIVTEWGLICSQDYIPNLITTVQMVGVLFGALITGQLADMFGRRKVLFLEYALMLLLLFASAFANSWQLYAALRFFIGALVGGTLVVNFVLPLEFVTPEWRTFCGCIGFWAVGLMTLALWAFILRDWRHLTMGTAVSGVFVLLSWWFVPESPRWLLSQGRSKEAHEILTNMAKFNKKPVPDFSLLESFVQREQQQRKEKRNYSYHNLFRTWSLAKVTLILMYAWFVSSAVYYGLNFNAKNLSGNRYLNVFLAGLVEIPALIFVVLVNNRLGRRKTTSTLMLTAGIFCFSILFLDLAGKLNELPAVTLTLAMIGKAGISGGWASVQVFSAESFPTVVRNLGVGACSMSARIGGIVAQPFVYLGQKYKPVPFTVFGAIAILCGLLMLLLPETVGQPLPDQLHPHKHSASQNGTVHEEVPLAESGQGRTNNDGDNNTV